MSADLISEKTRQDSTGEGSSGHSSHTTANSAYNSAASPAPTSDSRGPAQDHSLLEDHLYPDDSYTRDGVYWADLKGREQSRFINQTSNIEAKRELKAIGASMKVDPLIPVRQYFSRYVMHGMGLFVEGFVLFSIGNLEPLFKAVWPQCWSTHAVCNKTLVDSVTYLEIVGIIIGQILVGIEGDWIGRKFGLVQDAVVMLIGVVLLTSVWGSTLQGWVIGYTISLFIYGIGVGGEYPMTSTRALESGPNGASGTRDDRLHRGRNVVLAFLMQGWGQIVNQAILLLLMVIFHDGPDRISPPYTEKVGQLVYRVSFGFIAILHTWLAYYRYWKITDADDEIRSSKKKLNTSGYDIASLKLIGGHYWHRLVATSGGWFMNDFFFYGNKIFASVFIRVIRPGASLITTWEFNLLNIAVSLVGYYLAALLIDHKSYGRVRMQQVGFAMDFILFLFGAIFFESLQRPGTNIKIFQAMFYASSFFQQFGPNCVTFLVAAEVFPTSIRSTAHGVSAAIGKLGALAPTILYHYIDNHTKFWVVPWFGLVGALLTWAFLPDTTGLDLNEQERYWRCVRAGQPQDYHGVAIHPRHLSWYERVVLRRDKYYDPVQDKLDRIDELRVLYESHVIAQTDESGESHDIDHAFISPAVAKYFENEKGANTMTEKKQVQLAKEQKLHETAPETRMRSKLHDDLE